VALTCIDLRLNRLLPQVLGVPEDQFIWLRNAGNIITGPLSSTIRSLALACALKGGQAIVIIGHTDCLVGKITTMELIDRFRALGINREQLPENLNEYFGTFASEQANIIKAADLARHSPLISPRIAVHGLLVDIESGKLDWLVNGYQALELLTAQLPGPASHPGPVQSLGPSNPSALKFPQAETGATVGKMENWPAQPAQPSETRPPAGPPEPHPQVPPRIPIPPPIKPKLLFRKGPR
jgi:carbonic anhydrase